MSVVDRAAQVLVRSVHYCGLGEATAAARALADADLLVTEIDLERRELAELVKRRAEFRAGSPRHLHDQYRKGQL